MAADWVWPPTGDPVARLLIGDALVRLADIPDGTVQCCITSPPYWGLRAYLPDDAPERPREIGREASLETYIARLVAVFREVHRVLATDGTCWIVIGDTYVQSPPHPTRETPWTRWALGAKPKDLAGVPWALAFALREDGWYLRSEIIWDQTDNTMPESVKDRPTSAHETIFLLSKSPEYYYDLAAAQEPASSPWTDKRYRIGAVLPPGSRFHRQHTPDWMGPGSTRPWVSTGLRRIRDVWRLPHGGLPDHPAAFPDALAERIIRIACPLGGWVLDPFAGSGTVLAAALRLGRRAWGVELHPGYADGIIRRTVDAWRTPGWDGLPAWSDPGAESPH